MIDITPIPALHDNYIWALHTRQHAVLVDPGEAAPALRWLQARQLKLSAILCTHHHGDHTGGIAELCEVYNVPVYAPRIEQIPGTTVALEGGEQVALPELGVTLEVLDIRGHTRGHLAYLLAGMTGAPAALFCGDTLFGCGCGRIFEGTPEQMHAALQRLAALPEDTRVFCAHEYTEANIRFALVCEPDNHRLLQRAQEAHNRRAAGKPTLPSSIGLEKATNPFLRCYEAPVIHAAQQAVGTRETSELAVFTALREWKNHF